jgi:Domain of unknown function (DUF4145)
MKKEVYIPPAINLKAFNCPCCHVYANQEWSFLNTSSQSDGFGTCRGYEHFKVSLCYGCGAPTIWCQDKLIYPDYGYAEPPNNDMPDDIKNDYDEARSILSRSPRGAAALLRLAVQKLCKHLGQPGDNINSDIKALVAQGLPSKVQEALDSVRVIGNESVHPGQIDLRDDLETANMLFKLFNFIATKMITEPREIDEIYSGLPESKRYAIQQRDS